MKALVTCEQSAMLDAATRSALALSELQLMEKASLRLWDALEAYIAEQRGMGKDCAIAALCGKGDNGGDALAMLRHAYSSGYRNLKAILSARELGESCRKQADSLSSCGIDPLIWKEADESTIMSILDEAKIVLDGISGTGLSGPARGEAREMIELLNESRRKKAGGKIVAIDLPSGLSDTWRNGYPTVAADLTLSLEPAKIVCYLPQARPLCGSIKLVGKVFPDTLIEKNSSATLLDKADITALQPPLSAESYKMSRGRVGIFAGSKGTAGAAMLCAKAALASGAGYVTLYVDEELYPLLAPVLESVIVKPLAFRQAISPAFDAILAGPGWGQGEDRVELLGAILESGIPAILDADATRLLAAHPDLGRRKKAPTVLTPHPGEFAALAEGAGVAADEAPYLALERVCRFYDSLTVLKSNTTLIASPSGRRALWEGMRPELGTAGSGDVLAGLMAGVSASNIAFLRQAADPGGGGDTSERLAEALFLAAKCAVAVHGNAGARLAKSKGWFAASDLPEECGLLLHSSRSLEPPRY